MKHNNMYEYTIVDIAKEKKNVITKGKGTLVELREIIPSDIIEQIEKTDTISYELQMGNEIYIIKKIS